MFPSRADTDVKEGDTVHIIGEFDESEHCDINNDQNMIIVNPDLLISGTTVVSTVHCMRRYLLEFSTCMTITSRNVSFEQLELAFDCLFILLRQP